MDYNKIISELQALNKTTAEIRNKISGTVEAAQLQANIFTVERFIIPELKRKQIKQN